MSLDRMGGSASKGINGLTLTPLLKNDPSKELWVLNSKNGQKYRLKLNFREELCYLDGISLKLITKNEEVFFELLDGAEKESSRTAEEAGQPTDLSTARLDYRTLVLGINNLIEENANIGKPWYEYDSNSEKRIESVATTEFKVNVPPDIDDENLAQTYFLAITRSIMTKRTRLRLKQRTADKIKTTGYVRNLPSMMACLQNLLGQAGIFCLCLTPSGPYLKMEFWIDGNI